MRALGQWQDVNGVAPMSRPARGRRTVCALAIAALLCPASAGLVHAEGLGFFDALFGGGTSRSGAVSQPSAAPLPAYGAPSPGQVRRHARRAKPRPAPAAPALARARPAPRTAQGPRVAYASLPRPEARPRPEVRQPVRSASRGVAVDAVSAILNDSTLRPGDIVMFPDGPKVFKGGSQAPHKRGAFEDVRRSAAVSAETRRAVLDMASPVSGSGPAPERHAQQAAPADEARPTTLASVRVVYSTGVR